MILACAIGFPARAEETPIGFIKTLSGTVTVTHGDTVITAALAKPVYENDLLETDIDGELGVTFRDDTRIALGPFGWAEIRRKRQLLAELEREKGCRHILIDDPLKPEEALSDVQRRAANEWFDHTLYSCEVVGADSHALKADAPKQRDLSPIAPHSLKFVVKGR